MIKLCIFDLDGTLIDSAPDLMVSANIALGHYGLPQRSVAQIRNNMGKGVSELLTRSIPAEKYTQQLFDEIKAIYIEHYALHCTDHTVVYDGIYDMLRMLQQQGIKLAILTNKPHIFLSKIIADLFSEFTFDSIIGQGIYPDKPEPTAVFAILEELGFTQEQSVYVGDTAIDIQTGINAGLQPIGVSWGYRSVEQLKEAGAKHIIDTAVQLVDVIAKM